MQVIDPNDPEVVESLKYLQVSQKERLELQSRQFDSKVMCWVPDEKNAFAAATIIEKKGNETLVKLTDSNEQRKVPNDKVEQMNPPKFEKCEDMADLTYLNDSSVLHNLRSRYSSSLIYTYSGLFCVVINPYKRLPIYTPKVIAMYRNKKRNEVPPHLYAVADNAYVNMLRERENQSMLITGESGAGKTENTKKVIQYFAIVAANLEKTPGEDNQKANLEDQIVSANPLLESYGNAKTVRNNNSSRFGKFIRIHFGGNGRIAGADIATYLLEKARVIFQQKKERNYHIFYQLTSSGASDFHKALLLEPDASKYQYVAQGCLTVDGMDDSEEFKNTTEATKILGFTEEETLSMFKCTAALMHFGNTKWKQRPREEQAETEDPSECEKVAFLLDIEAADLIKGLLKPRIKVGNDYVNKGQNKDQVIYAIGALSKSIFEKLFLWMVGKINVTLDVKKARQYFIGVLDIAGFEIFEYNGFEQLCINYTNEVLQQFFNHHMFVLEQEEYTKEGIEWSFIDFGMDLQACIDLIEKPMGILSILEEECIIPKGSDEGFLQKLENVHIGKHPNLSKPKVERGKNKADFNLAHYAGMVPYSISGWLEKNKDPINTTIATLFANSKNALLASMFKSFGASETAKQKGGRSKKGGSMQTISGIHREQLNTLMTHLRSTHPHFVRCIIPNEEKKAGLLDIPLVLNQLHCNGVLEGIRICRKGFPNRMIYSEFKQRYSILAPNAVPKGFVDAKVATANILKDVELATESYKIGHTKIFFKAGILGHLEDMRDVALGQIIAKLQGRIRQYVTRLHYKKMLDQRLALEILQRNCNKYLDFRNWPWWNLYTKVKPLLSVARQEEEMKMLEEEYEKCSAALKKEEELRKQFEEQNARLTKEKNDLYTELEAEKGNTQAAQETADKLIVQKADLEERMKDLNEKLEEEEDNLAEVMESKRKLQSEIEENHDALEEVNTKLMKSENDLKTKEVQIRELDNKLVEAGEREQKLAKEKKGLEQKYNGKNDELRGVEEKLNSVSRTNAKLESSLDEVEDNLNREKKKTAELEKIKRKLESDLTNVEMLREELERQKGENEGDIKVQLAEITNLQSRLEDEEKSASSSNRKLKELQATIAELEEELETERSGRSKAERQRADLMQEIDELADRLDAAGSTSVAQSEVTKKREAELAKLRRDLDEATAQHESTITQLKKKHQEAVNEMGEQIEKLQKQRSKFEKDKQTLFSENEQMKMQLDQILKAKASAERECKQLEQRLSTSDSKIEELRTSLEEINGVKSRLSAQNDELQQQLEDAEYSSTSLGKLKAGLQNQITDLQSQLEDESRSKSSLMSQLRNMTADFESARNQLDDELESKTHLSKQIIALNSEIQQWKSRYETEGLARAEELEDAKRKLSAKLSAAEEAVEQAISKCTQLENAKIRLQSEVEDLMIDVERANANAKSMEKKQKQFDKTISEWKEKCDQIVLELEASQKEARTYSTELFKLKAKYEDCLQEIEDLKRDNKNLADEIKDIMDQTSEDARSVHELAQEKKRLELEKEELQVALEEAEGSIEQEENKVVRLQMELGGVRQEIDRKLREKEEEFDNTRRNHQRLLESMQATLEAETKAKQEAMRQKKKIETDVNELEVALDQSNRSVVDLQKSNQRFAQEVKDIQQMLEEEQIKRDEAREAAVNAERKLNIVANEIEELSTRAEQAEHSRRIVEGELIELNDRTSELSTINNSLSSQNRQMDEKITGLQGDLEEAIRELKTSDEKIRNAAIDAAKLAEELQNEQSRSNNLDGARKQLEIQIRDLQARYAEMEANSIKGGKRTIQKLQEKVQALSDELDLERHAHQEALKTSKKNERRAKELTLQADEDRRTHANLQDTLEKLRAKLRTYKRQAEEAEEVAAINLDKYRKAVNELNDVAERADSAEVMLNKLKARSRGGLLPVASTAIPKAADFSRGPSISSRAASIRPMGE